MGLLMRLLAESLTPTTTWPLLRRVDVTLASGGDAEQLDQLRAACEGRHVQFAASIGSVRSRLEPR